MKNLLKCICSKISLNRNTRTSCIAMGDNGWHNFPVVDGSVEVTCQNCKRTQVVIYNKDGDWQGVYYR